MIEKISTASCIWGLSLFIGFTGGNKADFKKDAVETKMHELTRSQATVTVEAETAKRGIDDRATKLEAEREMARVIQDQLMQAQAVPR